MASIFIDYDSNGDVELILEEDNNTCLDQAVQTPSSSENEKPAKYNVGPLSIKIKEVHLRASSLKLISSSSYFQAMFEGSEFREGKELKEHGFVKIELLDSEDEPTAMMIVLGILHGNDVHQVPIELDLPMLYKVAVLVDKYQWHALVTPHAISWLDKLLNSRDLPDASGKTLLMQLWIAWLFGMKDHFKALSRIAQQDSCHSIDLTDESIRLPTRAQKAINEQREVAFQKIEQVLTKFKKQLLNRRDQEYDPNPEHKMLRYMVFGYAKFFSQHLELGEFAAPDHAGSSIRSLRNRIDEFQSTEGFHVISPNGGRRHVISGGSWDLKKELQKTIIDLKMDEWGLVYDDFKPSLVDNKPNRVPGLE